ncbi:uncharacterized protein J3D65DRAFT_634582 [Phyllosticta citribraziliensis]|uniref:Secreted protein n=1 Tax=Phyllosticta citribraziliensis TaxID=989973 RepID=A0ABR1LEX4_9PEZI
MTQLTCTVCHDTLAFLFMLVQFGMSHLPAVQSSTNQNNKSACQRSYMLIHHHRSRGRHRAPDSPLFQHGRTSSREH